MRNGSVNGFSLRSDSILHFFFSSSPYLLLWPFPDKLLNSQHFFVTLELFTDNLPSWRLSLLFAKIFRSSLSRYKLLKKMLPGELASFLQRRLFRWFVTFPSSVLLSLDPTFRIFPLLHTLLSLFFFVSSLRSRFPAAASPFQGYRVHVVDFNLHAFARNVSVSD